MRILLFNEIPRTIKVSEAMFSSPLWGFLYLIKQSKAIEDAYQFSSPRWGFLFLMLFKTGNALSYKAFSSPRWGFLYLILIITAIEVAVVTVLVLSLGISLFNNTQW